MPRDLIAYPETVPDEISQSLSAAADYIEAHGFCGDKPFDGDRVCFVGAYYRLYPRGLDGSIHWNVAVPRLNRVFDKGGAVRWAIDNPNAKEEAVARLRAAAKLR